MGGQDQNDLKRIQYGLYGELFFFLMRRETFPTEAVRPRHVSTECLFSFVRPEDVRHPAGNDPLNQEALEGLPWPRPSGPNVPEAGPEGLHAPEHMFF